MTRQDALQTLQAYSSSPNLIKHHLAVAASLKEIGSHLVKKGIMGININDWEIAGLLHDADYELTRNNPEAHGLLISERLKDTLSPDISYAIQSHSNPNVIPKKPLDWALYCVDELTGFIILSAILKKPKSILSLTPSEIIDNINNPNFAKGVSRNKILICETALSIALEEFISITLFAMQNINHELGFEN